VSRWQSGIQPHRTFNQANIQSITLPYSRHAIIYTGTHPVLGGENLEVLEDASNKLAKLSEKDTFWLIDLTIDKLLAPQDVLYTRPFQYVKKGWGMIARVETTQDGTPTIDREPKRKKSIRKGESEVKSGDAWSFREENGKIMLPWATQWGLWKKTLTRSIIAQRKERYETAPLALIKVYPAWLDVGKAPCESRKDKNVPERVLEKRNVRGQANTMVETFFDWIQNRRVQFLTRIDGENPINDEKFLALVKTINNLDDIGPARRGSIHINGIKKVKLSEKEIKDLEQNNLKDLDIPIGPVGTIA